MGPYLKTAAAARETGLSARSLRMWAAQGRLTPAARTPGGHNLWDLADLRRQLAQLRETYVTAPATAPEEQPVVAAIVTCGLGVLMGRRNDGKPPWTFIAGEIEPGESPADAAIREVKEEAGLRIVAGDVIGRRVHPATGRTMVYMAARPVGGTAAHVGDEVELAEVRWVTLAEADTLTGGKIFPPVHAHLERMLP